MTNTKNKIVTDLIIIYIQTVFMRIEMDKE